MPLRGARCVPGSFDVRCLETRMSTPWYVIAAVCISAVALFVATKNYRRKAGIFVRGSFSIASSRDCDDQYVSNIILENLKDRATTVFSIYLRVGPNYYVEIEAFDEKPLLLRAYETYVKEYGPIQFYGINSNRMNLNALLKDARVPKCLVLSTSDGKYVVPSNIRRWSPVGDFFRNHMTAVVRPVRTVFKEKYVGGNIRYVIEFVGENGAAEIVPIHPEDFRLKMFRTFSLTRESLESVASLNAYLEEHLKNGKLLFRSFTVHDVDAWRQRASEFYTGKTIEAQYYGIFKYHIVGKVLTRISDRRLAKESAKQRLVPPGS